MKFARVLFTSQQIALVFICVTLGILAVDLVLADDDTPWTDATAGGPLGLAQVNIEETPLLTTIIGLDSSGQEVGKVELLHGDFELSELFAEDFDDSQVIGRRLDVNVLGQKLHWETAGFDPTLGLPSHPEDHWALAAFLEDARVKPALERWGIGFLPQQIKNKDSAFTCDLTGTHPYECSGNTKCPTLMNRIHPELFVPNSCGNSVAADDAWTVHQTTNDRYRWDVEGDLDAAVNGHYDQSFIAQCCRMPGSAAQYFKKSCSDSLTCSGDSCKTSCGTTSGPGQCRGCPAYTHEFSNGKCELRIQFAGWVDPKAPDEIAGHPQSVLDNKVYEVCSRVNWICGDGYCDSDEDCANCADDCACTSNRSCEAGTNEGDPARCCKNGKCEP